MTFPPLEETKTSLLVLFDAISAPAALVQVQLRRSAGTIPDGTSGLLYHRSRQANVMLPSWLLLHILLASVSNDAFGIVIFIYCTA